MPRATRPAPAYRKLFPRETALVRQHLLQLGPASRRSRFGGFVSDPFIQSYSEGLIGPSHLIYGAFSDEHLLGVGELCLAFGKGPASGEIAVSVAEGWQDLGIGSELVSRALLSARNRFLGHLYLLCQQDNHRMQRIAKKFGAEITALSGEILAEFKPPLADHLSLMSEWLGNAKDSIAYIRLGMDAAKTAGPGD
ncbi:MAG TPA: GNAT family N-acetyltransferase [Afifellaceae bacterium]|nr:GNAT family N-acetyltransferase [Afifellaceae bacterium]